MSDQLRLAIDGYYVDSQVELSDNDSKDSDWLGDNPLKREYLIKDRVIINPAMADREVFEEYFRYKVPKEIKTKKSDARKAKHQASLQNGEAASSWKQPYSVADDAKILKTLVDQKLAHLCLNEKLDLLMESLPGRSFESLRERHRKWLKLIDHASIKKIIDFEAQDPERAKDFYTKRGSDPTTKQPIVSHILQFPPKKLVPESESQSAEDDLPGDDGHDHNNAAAESANLGKRNLLDLEPVAVREDIQTHVAKLAAPESVEEEEEASFLLEKHLKWASVYHQMPMQQLLARISFGALNLGSLRTQMCKFTAENRVAG